MAFLLLPTFTSASELSLSLGQERWLYREFNSQQKELDREQGHLEADQVHTGLDFTDQDSLHADFEQSQGRLDYLGQTQNGVPLHTQTQEQTKRTVLSLRHRFRTLSLGLGALKQSWSRDIQAGKTLSGTDVAGLYEYYRWSGPLLELGGHWQWRALEAQLFFTGAWLSGDMLVDLSAVPVNGQLRNYGKPRIPLRHGYELGAKLELRYGLSENWFVLTQYAQSYRRFPKSASVLVQNGLSSFYLHEPQSTHTVQWLGLGLGYRF